jgi:hypothetical protein
MRDGNDFYSRSREEKFLSCVEVITGQWYFFDGDSKLLGQLDDKSSSDTS